MLQHAKAEGVAPLLAPFPRRLTPAAVIDGQVVNAPSQAVTVQVVTERLRMGLGFTLFTLNLDHLVKRRMDRRFRRAYERADIVTADGQPVVTLARREGVKLERTTGADLVLPLCAAAEAEGAPIYLFGASEASLAGACNELQRRFPKLDIRGCESPAMGFDPTGESARAAGERIAASGARLCFVALGAPKQELFAAQLAARHDGVGLVCIGAALDFISGHQHRAPTFFQRTGLEWAYRLATNPARLGRRYALCAVLYAQLRLGLSRPILIDGAVESWPSGAPAA
jgi:exopolysaccharide biosynthesis WecB/TagA/CpsF family protein